MRLKCYIGRRKIRYFTDQKILVINNIPIELSNKFIKDSEFLKNIFENNNTARVGVNIKYETFYKIKNLYENPDVDINMTFEEYTETLKCAEYLRLNNINIIISRICII